MRVANGFSSLFAAVVLVNCSVKTWRKNVDVENRDNWIGGGHSEDCSGLIFPERFESICMMGIRRITTRQIVLPWDGDVLVQEGGSISFSEANDDCVRLKQVAYERWDDPDNWISDGADVNRATPDVEKLPCRDDDVVFPSGSTFAVFLPALSDESVNSIRIGGVGVGDSAWQDTIRPRSECNQFVEDPDEWRPESGVTVHPENCTDRSGCVCHGAEVKLRDLCVHVEDDVRPSCFEPIRPIGHCRDFCGGVLHVKPGRDFDLRDFRGKLTRWVGDDVDVHVSKVPRDAPKHASIQIVLADRTGDFSGDSLDVTESLYSELRGGSQRWNVEDATMSKSGFPRGSGSLRAAILFAFGTLLAALAGFGMVFLAYYNETLPWPLLARLFARGRSSPSAAAARFSFARFDNRGDGGLSLAGSVISLENEFDNPLYGRVATAASTNTETGSTATGDDGPEVAQSSETTYENPVFFAVQQHEE